ncbi:arginine--tRNA ligase [bacterium]|nr:arginine--tRNA ligase [bacterium]
MIKQVLRDLLYDPLNSFLKGSLDRDWLEIEIPKQVDHGHFATPISFRLASLLKKPPSHIANDMADFLNSKDVIKSCCVCHAMNGFINMTLTDEYLYQYVRSMGMRRPSFDRVSASILVEYVSANPTGPLHIGHGRWAVLGDVICRLLAFTGQSFSSEFYVNDAGNQIQLFYDSVAAVKDNKPIAENGYQGDYIYDLATSSEDPVGRVIQQQKDVLASMGVCLDNWFSEKSLYQDACIDEVLALLDKQSFLEHNEGATWFKTTLFGDDKDRVLIKSDGSYTYFLVDIAYHYTKIQRGYSQLVTILGADHHGYVKRLEACVKALTSGKSPVELNIIIGQLVNLFRDGDPVRMSKRSGDMIALSDVIDEIGSDAVRFFLIQNSADTHIDFDLELAKKQSSENPVFYIQYAHARMHSLLTKLDYNEENQEDYEFTDAETQLLHTCSLFYDVVWDATRLYMPYKLAQYAYQLARSFHLFYEACPMKTASDADRQRRLALVFSTKRVLADVLELLGVTAPDRM